MPRFYSASEVIREIRALHPRATAAEMRAKVKAYFRRHGRGLDAGDEALLDAALAALLPDRPMAGRIAAKGAG